MATKGKSTDNPRAYLLKGDDEHQKREALEALLKTLVSDDFADFDLERLDGKTATSDRVLAGLNVPPFGSTRRVVLVKYANQMDEAEQLKLAERLDRIPESGCLILVNPVPEKADGRPKKGQEVKGELSRAVRKVGEVREFGAGKTGEKTAGAIAFARKVFDEAGKKIDPSTLETFVHRAGTDHAVLLSEAHKLIDYLGDADRITGRDVSAVTSETPEEKIFKLTDSVALRNKAQALRFLNELFEAGTSPDADAPKTLATLSRHFRLLWQMKALQESRVRTFAKADVPDSVKALLPSDPNVLDVLGRQAWQARKLQEQSAKLTRKDLARCFAAIARADAMLKGAAGDIEDPKLVMELLVMELAGK